MDEQFESIDELNEDEQQSIKSTWENNKPVLVKLIINLLFSLIIKNGSIQELENLPMLVSKLEESYQAPIIEEDE